MEGVSRFWLHGGFVCGGCGGWLVCFVGLFLIPQFLGDWGEESQGCFQQ